MGKQLGFGTDGDDVVCPTGVDEGIVFVRVFRLQDDAARVAPRRGGCVVGTYVSKHPCRDDLARVHGDGPSIVNG